MVTIAPQAWDTTGNPLRRSKGLETTANRAESESTTPDSQAHERGSIRVAPRSFRVRDQALRQHHLLPAVIFGHSWNTTARYLARVFAGPRKGPAQALGAHVHL